KAPDRLAVALFPAFQITDGRIDFKFGVRKTNLYITDSDLSIYPERSGKLYVQFSGSPARTDRAGNGFGHFRGSANWYMMPASPSSNQLEADVTLDPSNLSELTTLFQGEDVGVHGTISSHAKIEGPQNALRISGELHLEDIHRWDLMPSSGERWRVPYEGTADLVAHRLELKSLGAKPAASAPVSLDLRVKNILTNPSWALIASLNDAPGARLLPIARRMGLALPDSLKLEGTLNGALGYSNVSGWSGGVQMSDVVASLPEMPPFRAAAAVANLRSNVLHVEPATIASSEPGSLQVGGDYDLNTRAVNVKFAASEFPIAAFRSAFGSWLGEPAVLEGIEKGTITGEVLYAFRSEAPAWAGEFQFSKAQLSIPGVAVPFTEAEGQVTFDANAFDLRRFSATAGGALIEGAYHHDELGHRPDRIALQMPAADLSNLESLLGPTLRRGGLLARLGMARRTVPDWLAARNLQGDVQIGKLSINGTPIGSIHSHVRWTSTTMGLTGLRVRLGQGDIVASGMVTLAFDSPRYRLTAQLINFPWHSGMLSADGQLQTSGTGSEALQHLEASGTFAGRDLNLSADDSFSAVSGAFKLSFGDGWPNLSLSDVQMSDGDEAWTGSGSSDSSGNLVIEVEHEGQQRRIISSLIDTGSQASSEVSSAAAR
ncbi:MAG: hypothetical protein JO061_24275, partial [Acidobacteriaceae bacterium]|nr:hypothetical protein [Acidobacteriaceae bacterium]